MGDSLGGCSAEAGVVPEAERQGAKCSRCGKRCKSEHGVNIHQAKEPNCGQAEHKTANERTQRCGKCSAYFKKSGMKIHERTCNPAEVMRRKTNAIRQVETPAVDPAPSAPVIAPMPPNQPTTESIVAVMREKWTVKFQEFAKELSVEEFNQFEEVLQEFIQEINDKTPKPPRRSIKHPNMSYHQKKKTEGFQSRKATYGSSNPQRKDDRMAEASRKNHQWRRAQYMFKNKRRKLVSEIIQVKDNRRCEVPKEEVERYFKALFSQPNHKTRPRYESPDSDLKEGLDSDYLRAVTASEAMKALNSLRMDAAAGPDKVSVKMLKDVDKHGEIMASVASVCCLNEKFPEVLQNARTVLLPKTGDPKKMTSWRGISICSAIRRCISKVLCHRLNMYVNLSEHQKGFRRLPGLLENVARLQGILTASVEEDRGVSVAFLDISKAFDNVGHEHLEKTLSSLTIPGNLRRVIVAMYSGLTARVEVGGEVTEAVPVRRGVLQGDPLSPLLFNLTINFLLNELNDYDLKKALGFIVNDILALSAFAFADDLVIVGKNRAALALLVRKAIDGLDSIGLVVNGAKSTVMDIAYRNGERVVDSSELDVGGGVTMPAMTREETVVYLGVKYRYNLGFDLKQELEEFGGKLQKLHSYPFLHADQKFALVKQYLWPTMIYDLQMAPLGSNIVRDLTTMDDVIKLFAFSCLRLPSNAPTGFLFASRASGGLAMPKPTEEYAIQQINSAVLLNNSTDEYVREFRKPSQEIKHMLESLDTKVEVSERDLVKPRVLGLKLRAEYRERAFKDWSKQSIHGSGAETFPQTAESNHWILSRPAALPVHVHLDMIRSRINWLPVKAVPGCTTDTDHRCRHCRKHREDAPLETLSHIWGQCEQMEDMRSYRHDEVVKVIARELRKQDKWEVTIEERTAEGLKPDLIVRMRDKTKAWIIDPTIRMETTVDDIRVHNEEKERKYSGTGEELRAEGFQEVFVHGLWFGARDVISKAGLSLLRSLGINQSVIDEIVSLVLNLSHSMYRMFMKS